MMRINFALMLALSGCALALVASQHQARRLFVELQREQARSQQLEIEFGQLQLELSTWATRARVERIAQATLQMRAPPAARVRVVPPPPAPSNP